MGEHGRLRDAASVDAAWLTAALHSGGVGLGREILSFDARSIGTGQVGENVRYELVWSEAPADTAGSVPSSVVAKFPSTSAVSRSTAVQVDTYRREVGFYRDIQSRVAMRTPTIHHLGWDPDTHDFVLVMEDIRAAEQGDQIEGCSVDRALAVIDEAVGLHAPTWGAVEPLAELDWLSFPSAERVGQMEMLFALTLPGFLDRYRDRLTRDEIEIGRRVVDGYAALSGLVSAWAERHDAWCVTHADYRLDNILFGVTDAAPSVTVVDWQTVAVGIGPSDIAYFLGAGLVPDDRRSHEHELVRRYAAGLRSHGVEIDDVAAWDGYVLGSAGGYLMAIVASQIVEKTARGDDMFVAMASRHAAQIVDLGLLDRL